MTVVDPVLVTVVVPTYNHAHFLGAALQSVIDQTCGDWEAIVVDNHSQDNTAEVIAAFADPRIRRVLIDNQGIIAASRNLGIGQAKGDYVAFLDSDDTWYPDKLARCVRLLAEGHDLVCHGERWVGGRGRRDVVYGPASRASYESLLFRGNCLSTSAIVMRRDRLLQLGSFCEDAAIVTAEDYDLWLRVARAGLRIAFVAEVLGEFRIHGGNQSGAVLRNVEATREVVRRHIESVGGSSWRGRLRARRRRAILDYSCGRGFQDLGRHREAWPWFFRAVVAWPFQIRCYLAMALNAVGRHVR
jgi:glycosyltransferase involved in cell wall biosynthesis